MYGTYMHIQPCCFQVQKLYVTACNISLFHKLGQQVVCEIGSYIHPFHSEQGNVYVKTVPFIAGLALYDIFVAYNIDYYI